MNIYIAKDHSHVPMGAILAKNKDMATAFFMGKYPDFDSIEEIDPNSDIGVDGLCILITTSEKNRGSYFEPDNYREVMAR